MTRQQVVNAKGLTDEKRAEELRYLLNRYLNFKSSNRAQAEEKFEGMVKKIVNAFDGTVHPPAPTAVQQTPLARPVTPMRIPKGSFPESPVVQQLYLDNANDTDGDGYQTPGNQETTIKKALPSYLSPAGTNRLRIKVPDSQTAASKRTLLGYTSPAGTNHLKPEAPGKPKKTKPKNNADLLNSNIVLSGFKRRKTAKTTCSPENQAGGWITHN